MVSRVLAATPPSVPDDGEGRMKALSSLARCAMRVLSARIEPPVRRDDGSTARTATLRPWPVSLCPSASIRVDLPTPGAPVMPTRTALPVSASSAWVSAAAVWRWSARLLSTSVMARDSTVRSPLRTSRASRSTSGGGGGEAMQSHWRHESTASYIVACGLVPMFWRRDLANCNHDDGKKIARRGNSGFLN